MLWCEQPAYRIVADAESYQHQHDAERYGGQRFDSSVTVWMLFVRILGAVLGGHQHHHIGRQIGQRVYTVRDQCVRGAQPAGQHLQHRKYNVDHCADQSNSACIPVTRFTLYEHRFMVAAAHCYQLQIDKLNMKLDSIH